MDGIGGTQTWCGYGIFANNSIKISRLIANNTNLQSSHHPADTPEPLPQTTTNPPISVTTNPGGHRLDVGPPPHRRARQPPTGATTERQEAEGPANTTTRPAHGTHTATSPPAAGAIFTGK